MQLEYIYPFLAATMKVLKTMAMTDAKPGKPFKKENNVQEGVITGIIGLTGGTSGSVCITFTEQCIVGIVNNMLGESYTGMNADISDAVGELVNMISGEARRDLAEKGFVFQAGRPELIEGDNHTINHKVDGPVAVIPFKTENGVFHVETCFKSDSYFNETHNVQKAREIKESNTSVMQLELQSFLGEGRTKFKGFYLKPNSQVMKPNFFLLPEYIQPTEGNDFVNFTALEVNVCPDTYFASSEINDFRHIQNANHPHFENVVLQQVLIPQLSDLKDKGLPLGSSMYSIGRTVETSILAYNLAIRTSELLYQYNPHQFSAELGKIGDYSLKSALLSKLERSMEREKDFLYLAHSIYRKSLSMAQGEQFFRRCFRLVAISVYLQEFASAKESTAVMIRYFQKNSSQIRPDEAPRIKRYIQLVDKIYNEKENFSITKHQDRTDYLFL